MRQERVQRQVRKRAPRRDAGSADTCSPAPRPSTEAASSVVLRIDRVLREASPRPA